MEEFNLEKQYQKYLQRVRIDESMMHPTQRSETKRAFFGACGQMLVLLRDELSVLPEETAILALEDLNDQVLYFWKKQTER